MPGPLIVEPVAPCGFVGLWAGFDLVSFFCFDLGAISSHHSGSARRDHYWQA